MTSHPSVGNRRPPLPASSSSFPRPPSRTVSHASPRIPRSASQQVVIDLTDATASSSSRDTSGPAYKKQRLDDGTSSGGARSPLLPDGELVRQASQRSIVGSPASLNTNATSLNSPSVQDPRYAGDRSRPALPFPVRPGRYAPRTGKRPSFDKAGTRGDVRAKPYVLSVPAPAPQYSADSKSISVKHQDCGEANADGYVQDRQTSSPGRGITPKISSVSKLPRRVFTTRPRSLRTRRVRRGRPFGPV